MSATELLPGQAVAPPLSLKELGEVLVRHYGLTEGRYEVMVQYQMGAGMFGPSSQQHPGIAVTLVSVGLAFTTQDGPMTVDAAALQGDTKGRKQRKPR